MQHRTLMKKFNSHSDDVIKYFDPCLELLEGDYRYQVVISYMFSRIEIAHRETLYFGALKHHDVDRELASKAIDSIDLSRQGFRHLFKQIYGYTIPKGLIDKMLTAEKTRDRILHGKKLETGEMSIAILNTIDYFDGLNNLVTKKSKVWLAGNRTGMFGKKSTHSKATSRWVLMGMGLLSQPKAP